MSLESARNFTARLIGEPKLAAELAAATVGKSSEEKAIAAAHMAARLGYECTAEEAGDAVVSRVSGAATGDSELTDEQLEAVVGGISVPIDASGGFQ